jgi:hypothetical protein
MRHVWLVAALTVVSALAGPIVTAGALDVPSAPALPVAANGVVFTQDGGVVFEARTTTEVWTVYRLAPGATEAQSLMTLAGPRPSLNGVTLHSLLGAAGPGSGFLLAKYFQGQSIVAASLGAHRQA